jgi:hypothetical protein
MWTGEESKTWTFQAAAGYASMATDDRELQNAIGVSADLMANVASGAHGILSAPTMPISRLPGYAEAFEGLESGSVGALNTGKTAFIHSNNCPFTSAAGGQAFPTTSSEMAALAGKAEGPIPVRTVGEVFRDTGLHVSGTPEVARGTLGDATQYMKGWPKGTKFVIVVEWQSAGAHAFNGKIGSFGLVFNDYQKWYRLPFLRLPSHAKNASVWVIYVP